MLRGQCFCAFVNFLFHNFCSFPSQRFRHSSVCHSVLPHQLNYRGQILGVDDSSRVDVWLKKKKSPERSTFPRLRVRVCVSACELHTPMVTHSPCELEEQVGQLEIKGVSRKRGCVVCLTSWGRLSQCIQLLLTLPRLAFTLTHTHTVRGTKWKAVLYKHTSK